MTAEYQANRKSLVSYIAGLLKDSHDLQANRPLVLVLITEISHAAYQLGLDEDCRQWRDLARLIGMYGELAKESNILAALQKLEGGTDHDNNKEN